jgi:peptidoglycan/xylan/chitin deacetylase (PgdA/CDA1 family)
VPVPGPASSSASPSPSPSSASPTTKPPTSKPPTSKAPGSPAPGPAGTASGHGPYGSIAVTGSGATALTFDDGPGPYTAQILDLLEKYHIKATFCMIGRQVSSYPDDIRRMVADGDTLCNHTWDHDEQLRTRTDDQIRAELQKTNDAIHAIVPDAEIEYFRNPGGNFGPNTVAIAKDMGMKSLYWSVDPRDWSNPGTQSIINTVSSKTRAGSIVLSHDGGGDRSQTVAAYKVLLPNLKARLNLIALPVD